MVAAEALAARPGAAGGLIGFGHSMGGAGLLMAAARRPGLFRLLVVFEPIVFPPDRPDAPTTESPLVAGARRRRPVFDSFEAAIANYASKPPLGAFDPEALDAYVRYGLRPEGDHLRLKCEPEHEARTFEQGGRHHAWDGLASIDIPVVVVAGGSRRTSRRRSPRPSPRPCRPGGSCSTRRSTTSARSPDPARRRRPDRGERRRPRRTVRRPL